MNTKSIFHLTISVALIILLSSCGPPNEKAHPAFQKGENLMDKGEYKEAAENFERYLTFNYNSSMTHYKLAELYNDYVDDPFLAVYHFRQYLKLEPNATDRETITKWIESAEEKMVERIRERNPDFISMEEIDKLKENNSKYREYLIKLKTQNAVFRKKLSSGTMVSFKNDKKDSGDSPKVSDSSSRDPSTFVISKVYKVKSGDNLSRISSNVYGSSKYYKLIFEANRDILDSESKLNVGQELRIPQLTKETESDLDPIPEEAKIPGVITD